MYRRSTSKKQAAEAEREARLEEKEATSAEDVEEILLEIEDRQPEPAEEVQQPEDEPEVIQQETQPEASQPEKPTRPGDMDIIEILISMREESKKMMEKMDENSRSTKEELVTINKKIEEGQKSTKEELSKKIEAVSYTHLHYILS